jgi:hypothetical protein
METTNLIDDRRDNRLRYRYCAISTGGVNQGVKEGIRGNRSNPNDVRVPGAQRGQRRQLGS